jgi:hypothetical protein
MAPLKLKPPADFSRGTCSTKRLPHRPRSVDRTRSPIGVSQKREYFKYQPETIDDFALRLSQLGVQRRSDNLQKAAIGGRFSDL